MVNRPRAAAADSPAIVMDIGNMTINVATWQADRLKTPLSVPTSDDGAFDQAFAAHIRALPNGKPAATVIGSVVPTALERIRARIEETADQQVLVVGETIPLPMDVDVEDVRAIGVDRVCAAAAAFEKVQTACSVVDFGTAVTVDLVEDDGTLVGGAILPGLDMQLRALHEQTALLPLVKPAFPEHAYGRNTVEAMQTGVCCGLAGAVRSIIEGYATKLNRWPQVLATGGDLAFMASHCDFLDTQVQHLTLRGIGLAYANHLAAYGV